ncbi:MAG: ProQ/FINO family protein [Pseudomonadota bacterium]
MTDMTTPAAATPAENAGKPDAARKPRPQGNRRPHPAKAAPQARPQREVNPLLEKLFELHPKLFGAQFLPLKLGIFQDLLARHPDVFKKDELKLAMGQHARSTRYLESVAAGLARHDLDGNAVEPVSPEHVHHAILEVFRRRQARSKEDLRPRVIARIVAAIEASGLPREEYAERVRVQDESANSLVDEALSQLKLEAAKRDALMATFKASGKTEAEFAEMYGMDLREVAAVLERVRRDQAA